MGAEELDFIVPQGKTQPDFSPGDIEIQTNQRAGESAGRRISEQDKHGRQGTFVEPEKSRQGSA